MTSAGSVVAGFSYNDRIAPLLEGRVSHPAIDLRIELDTAARIFERMRNGHAFDVAEMSLAAHAMACAQGDDRFIGLPVFTSRMFRHHSIYVCGDTLYLPRQLRGRRIGIANYLSTTAVWLRGIMAEFYGLDPQEVTWFVGGHDGGDTNWSGTVNTETLPAGLAVEVVPAQTSLLTLLEQGQIDALITPGLPPQITQQHSQLRPLFDDVQAAERSYFKASGIFPIMHLCVLKKSLHQQHTGLANGLVELFDQAQQLALERLSHTDAPIVMAPCWPPLAHPDLQALPARGWAYGLEANQDGLDTFLRYLYEQGLVTRPVHTEELFTRDTRGGS